MGSITSLKCVLTQEHLDAICAKYFVPEEVHPQLPSPDATMHERPAGKVGMYTRFFDYANYRIPFSTFFVSVLTHFRIPFSQLSVFGSAKVSHFEILCRVCNIEPNVSLFRYFYTHNYKNGWFGFTKRPNVRACYSKNLDSVKNWNDHFFWVDEFVVPANARFSWFSGSNIVKDRAPAPSEYNVEHINALIAQASPFLRFPEEFLCWVGISRNYLLNKDTYPRFEYENGEEMDLNAFIRTADPRKVRIVERARAENERPIVTVAKHRTVTLLPTSVVRSSGELSASVERKFIGDASVGDGGDQGFDSVGGQDNVEPTVPVTEHVEKNFWDKVTKDEEWLLQYSLLMVEQGVLALLTLPFITSSVTASPLEEGGDRTDSVTGPSLRTVGLSARFVVLSDSSHHSDAKSADPEVDSLVRLEELDIKWQMAMLSVRINRFEKKAGRKMKFNNKDAARFDKKKVKCYKCSELGHFARECTEKQLELHNKPMWNNVANIPSFVPKAAYVPTGSRNRPTSVPAGKPFSAGWKNYAARPMTRPTRGTAAQVHARVSRLEAIEGSLRGEVASAKEHNGLLEQECGSLKLKAMSLEYIIAKKDRKLSDLGTSSSSLRSQNQSLVNQVHELETSSTDLHEKLETYERSMKLLEGFQDNFMRPLETRLAEIDADFTRCCMRFQESFHQHLLNALGNAFSRAIEKGMQEGLAAGIEHEQAGRCLTDLEAYIPFAEDDFNSAVSNLRGLNFSLLQEISNKKDASTWDIMDLLRLDDVVAKALGMTDLQPDVNQLMVPVHQKQDRVVIGSQALSVALDICHGKVEKMERNLVERLPFLKDVFVSLDHPLSAEALIEPPVEVLATNVLSTVVIVPYSGPSISVEDYENPDLVDVVPKNVTPGLEGKETIDASTGGDLAFSKLDDEARDAVL
ncbi:gypsy type transposase [Tanacetum coccineum]